MKDRPHDEAAAEAFRENPAYAVELLNAILKDDEKEELQILLRQFERAMCGDRGSPTSPAGTS